MNWSGVLYQCADVKLAHQVADLDVFTPLDMRAPGAALGLFALESALDELAHLAGIDPLRMRLLNYAERDQRKDEPFSSKALRECYAQGAARFGWDDIDVIFVDEQDDVVSPLGVKGLGELGIVGVAVANAVFHATGKRVRELPITLDKLL